jgi:hypothetical protein
MSLSTQTEQFFLKVFKFGILVLMGLSLLGSVIALVVGLWFMSATPKAPDPVQEAPKKEVNIDEFLKQLEKPGEEPQEEGKKSESPPAKPAAPKYKDEARKIIACLNESNTKSQLQLPSFSEEVIEEFRRDLQRVADMAGRDRGQPYVDDAVRVVCAILQHEKVIALRKKNKELRVFIPAVNFHIQKWDELKAEARRFEAAEQKRLEEQQNAEELRVELSRDKGKVALMGAGAALGLFMLIAIYLLIAAMESHLRQMSRSLELMRTEPAPRSAAQD